MKPSAVSRAIATLTLFNFVMTGCMAPGRKSAMSPGAAPAAYHSAREPVAAGPAVATDGKKKDGEPETWKRSQLVPNTARVMVGDKEELALRGMQTSVTIDGFRARVVIDYLFANERNHTMLEGTFQLRLPEEASPYFFAFGMTEHDARTQWSAPMVIATSDNVATAPAQIMAQRQTSWTQPKEARMVPREKAAHAYTEVVQRRVDPALVEWAGAGVFNARVYPLMSQRLHRIVVGYDVDLVRIGDSLEYRFDLPEKLPASTVDVSVAKLGHVVASTTPSVAPRGVPGRQHYRFEGTAEKTIKIRLDGAAAGAPTIVGTDPLAGDFFAAQVTPVLPASGTAQGADTAVFMLDTSLSSNPDRFNIWLKMLRAVLDQNRGSLHKFGVLFFSVDAHWYRRGFVDNTPENVDALLAYANGLALEGATDLGAALAEAARPAWLDPRSIGARYDLFLLGDGAVTWGEGNHHALGRILASGQAGSLFTYQTGLAGTDVAALTHLARESGGAVFSITGESEIARAAVAHRARPWMLVDVKLAGARDILLAGRPIALFPGQTLLAVGRGVIAPGAELQLTVERAGHRELVKTRLAPPIPSALASRAYGQVATSHLEDLETATESVAKAYATHFRITGRTCSLLMLESEQDYQRFGIVPENDAKVVTGTLAGELFERTMRETYKTLGDPKAAFLAMLAKLERTPGVSFRVPADYKAAVMQMPTSAFTVPTAPLATRIREKKQLTPAVLGKLAAGQLEYDFVSTDAIARKASGAADVLKALSSLVEQNPGDGVLARDIGFSAMELGLRPQAYHLFRRVADLRPYEPQTYRAMAQALSAMGMHDLALAYYEIPLIGTWDPRFGELRKIVELDYLRLLRKMTNGGVATSVLPYAKWRRDALVRQVGMTQADVLVTIMWNTDNTDVDLHIKEPTGEECSYRNRKTRIGGEITQDVTRGYGPEMYVLKRAPNGRFSIRTHYFASDRNRTSARTKVYVQIFQNWGTALERIDEQVVSLQYGKEWHEIAALDFGKNTAAIATGN